MRSSTSAARATDPVGIASGSFVCVRRTFGTSSAGNSSGLMSPPLVGLWPSWRERDEVIRPRDQLAGVVEAALERVEAADAIEVVLHVVFARPLQLHRHAGLLGDQRGLAHVVVHQAATEAAADARLVQRHFLVRNAEHGGDQARLAASGVCVGAQISTAPSLNEAVQFCGSSGACDTNG